MPDFFHQIWSLLNRRERWRLLLLFAMMLFAALLEVLGIGLVMPVIALVANPELIRQNSHLSQLYQLFGAPDDRRFILLACLAVSAAFLAKSAFLFLLTRRQASFTSEINVRLSSRLFENYLRLPYERYLRADTSAFLHTLNITRQICQGTILAALMLLTECAVIVAILLLLVFLSPLTTLILSAILILAVVGTHRVFRAINRRLGERSRALMILQMATARQGIDGLKEYRIHNAEQAVCEHYRELKLRGAQVEEDLYVMGQVPRLLIEAGAVTLGMGVVAVLVLLDMAMGQVLLTVSVFAMAIVRMMPSLSRLQYYLTHIRQNIADFRGLLTDLQPAENALQQKRGDTDGAFLFQRQIELREISFTYQTGSYPILNHLSFTIPHLASVAVVGPTGCGKTTLADLLLGLLQPQAGSILVDGKDIAADPVSWRRLVGYVPQSIYLLDAPLRENIAFGVPPEQIDDDRVRHCLQMAQILPFVEGLPEGIRTNTGEKGVRLSGGQKQRIGIARALYRQPQLLVLDEATSALDTETERALTEALDQLHGKLTIVMIAHRLSTIERCDLRLDLSASGAAPTDAHRKPE